MTEVVVVLPEDVVLNFEFVANVFVDNAPPLIDPPDFTDRTASQSSERAPQLPEGSGTLTNLKPLISTVSTTFNTTVLVIFDLVKTPDLAGLPSPTVAPCKTLVPSTMYVLILLKRLTEGESDAPRIPRRENPLPKFDPE